jgi:hypothetical protein
MAAAEPVQPFSDAARAAPAACVAGGAAGGATSGEAGAAALPAVSAPLPKVIFLDVDGVLVTARGLLGEAGPEDSSLLFFPGGPPCGMEARCLAALAALVTRTGARLVVSSTWRCEAQCPGYLPALRAALALAGIGGAFLGCTPASGHRTRGDEIVAWLREHPHHPSFAILEDSDAHVASFAARVELRARYVQTTMAEGLTEELAAAVEAILA